MEFRYFTAFAKKASRIGRCNPLVQAYIPGWQLIFGGKLAEMERMHEIWAHSMGVFFEAKDDVINKITVGHMFVQAGYSCSLTDLGQRVDECRTNLAKVTAVASRLIGLPSGSTITVENADSTMRAVFEMCMHDYFPEFGGNPWFSIRGEVLNYRAIRLLLEPDGKHSRADAAQSKSTTES